MRGNIGNMMKQAQMVQENMRQMQEKLGTIEVEGQAGAGMVKVVMTCRHDVKRVSIDQSLVSDENGGVDQWIGIASRVQIAFLINDLSGCFNRKYLN